MGSPRPSGRGRIEAPKTAAASESTARRSPRPSGRGRIEARRPRSSCDFLRPVLHGLRVVAALKRGWDVGVRHRHSSSPRPSGRGRIEASPWRPRVAWLSGSPRPSGRGRIEAVSSQVGGLKIQGVLHGLRVVAALKLTSRLAVGDGVIVLHGLRVVAALKPKPSSVGP